MQSETEKINMPQHDWCKMMKILINMTVKLLPFYGFDQNFIHRVLESLLLFMLID
jgi:hypothetical protein